MRTLFKFSLLILLSITIQQSDAQNRTSIRLNDEGIAALNAKNYSLAISKLDQACRLDPNYSMARSNLAIAHNNFALNLYQHHLDKEALKEFHRAISANPDSTTQANMINFLKLIGRNPENVGDRVSLGDESKANNDLLGAVIEYKAALHLKESKDVHQKLGQVYKLLHNRAQAAKQFELSKS